MNLQNKRGAALFQVLIVAAILAGISAMVLRASLSRTLTARQVRHTVSAQLLMESCMAEVNNLWAAKTPEQYAEDLAACRFYADEGAPVTTFNCKSNNARSGRTDASFVSYNIVATISTSTASACEIKYTIQKGTNNERATDI